MSLRKSLILIISVLLLDQISKFYIKTHFALNESHHITDWFKILFVENDGMAWGTKISDFITFLSERTAKLILTIFRIFAVIGIGYWLFSAVRSRKNRLMMVAISLVFAGALGNIIDSVFYGLIFNDSYGQVANFLPSEGGYDGIFFGKVVDMLHFPIWQGFLPEWLPILGGNHFTFFDPVFNIADMAISTGIGIFIFFNKRVFGSDENDEPERETFRKEDQENL